MPRHSTGDNRGFFRQHLITYTRTPPHHCRCRQTGVSHSQSRCGGTIANTHLTANEYVDVTGLIDNVSPNLKRFFALLHCHRFGHAHILSAGADPHIEDIG